MNDEVMNDPEATATPCEVCGHYFLTDSLDEDTICVCCQRERTARDTKLALIVFLIAVALMIIIRIFMK
jgi:hypothetical protein